MKNHVLSVILFLTPLSHYAQRYTFLGTQISSGIAVNSVENKIKPAVGGGLVADWLVRGDMGALRLGLGYQGFSGITTENNTVHESFVSQIDIPLTYRWTYLRATRFNFQLGNGVMIPINRDLKIGYYITYGLDCFLLPIIGRGYIQLGLNFKHTINNTSINIQERISPFLAQLTLSLMIQTSPKN
jgi:hypothetical protein